MASKHQQEDPWAGFVDVLSNILMVVIFLVVILGVAIFALSQQITKVAVEKAVKAERESQERQTEPAPKDDAVSQAAPTSTKAPDQTAPAPEADQGAAGAYEAAKALRARESDDIAGNTNLCVRSTATKATKEIEIASEDTKPSEPTAVMVKLAQAFLTLKFERGSFKIDKNAAGEIQSFLGDQAGFQAQKVEIRAFAQSTVGSISEARRIAYYRAMQTRTELLKSGFSAANMEVKIRESVLPEEIDVVRIFKKT